MGVTELPDAFTIDELSQRSGIPSSTIRLYQSKDLLAPPTKTGRVGHYGQDHLDRLQLIGKLQDDGFSLAGIGRLLQASRDGQALDDVLSLEARVAATWGGTEPKAVTFEELSERFPGGLPTELAQRALGLGLVRVEAGHVVVDDPRFLEIGSELARMGVPLGEVLDEFELLKRSVAPIADRFTDLFRDYVWSGFAERGLPLNELPSLVADLERLNQLARDIVTGALEAALRQSAESFLTEESETIQKAAIHEVLAPLLKAAGLTLPEK
jgi:DNA-binding transcriptional MerR regulator